jgi:hypothetical protein
MSMLAGGSTPPDDEHNMAGGGGGVATTADTDKSNVANFQLLSKLYQLLIECQNLGDQKVKITNQIIECISKKTRQLGLDSKLNGLCYIYPSHSSLSRPNGHDRKFYQKMSI